MTRHPELTALVGRLRAERPRPKLRWSQLVERAREVREPEPRWVPPVRHGVSNTPK